ncbi:Vps51/Vps67-domain-containing protein [Amanita rubescens]|nr:Vps51/Vps67-domain-containing protein [Amanita rubescens]
MSSISKPATPSPLRPSSPSNSRRSVPPSPPGRSRARDLLRKHYGLSVGPPAPLPRKVMDPMNLDSPAFDARSYYEQLITTSSLPQLLRRENELVVEIRQLDSERQSLVYNHHHELIAASDTIAAIKSRAESLEADLDSLKAAFSEISRLSSEIAIEEFKEPSSLQP